MDTALTDGEMGLAQLLGNDLGRSIWVEEAITQDLADDLVGAAVVGFRAGFEKLKSGQAAGLESFQELIVALTAVAVFLSDRGDVLFQALAFDEHKETMSQLVL